MSLVPIQLIIELRFQRRRRRGLICLSSMSPRRLNGAFLCLSLILWLNFSFLIWAQFLILLMSHSMSDIVALVPFFDRLLVINFDRVEQLVGFLAAFVVRRLGLMLANNVLALPLTNFQAKLCMIVVNSSVYDLALLIRWILGSIRHHVAWKLIRLECVLELLVVFFIVVNGSRINLRIQHLDEVLHHFVAVWLQVLILFVSSTQPGLLQVCQLLIWAMHSFASVILASGCLKGPFRSLVFASAVRLHRFTRISCFDLVNLLAWHPVRRDSRNLRRSLQIQRIVYLHGLSSVRLIWLGAELANAAQIWMFVNRRWIQVDRLSLRARSLHIILPLRILLGILRSLFLLCKLARIVSVLFGLEAPLLLLRRLLDFQVLEFLSELVVSH